MGDQFIDIILFGLVALFFAVQLWRVLGQRTGAERPPQFPPAVGRATSPASNNVIAMPSRTGTLPAHDAANSGIEKIRQADPGFQADGFLAGAKQAFEIAIQAFADGDTGKLRAMASDDVYDAFAESIRQRVAENETVQTSILHLDPPVLVEAWLESSTAFTTVRFVSTQTSVVHAADGTVVDGDPAQPVDHTDLWTFSRNTRSADPNWLLIGTGTPA